MMVSSIDTSSAIASYDKAKLDALKLKGSKDDAKLKEQTDAFESLFVKQILDEGMKMNDTLFPKSAGSDIYKSMYTDTISKSMTGGFGYSKLLFDYLKDRG
jgi:peptidoglycan hydrolase FlgJ